MYRVRHSASSAAESWRKSAHFDKTLSKERPSILLKEFLEFPHTRTFSLFCKLLMPKYQTPLAEITRRYTHEKDMLLNVTPLDIGQLFGLMLLSCYHSVPSEDAYWSTAEDLAVPFVATVMHQKQFHDSQEIFSCRRQQPFETI